MYPNGNTSVLHLLRIQTPSAEPEQNVLSSQSSTNLCESLSILLFVVEQGLPSGDIPDRTEITNELQRITEIRMCDNENDGGICASGRASEAMGNMSQWVVK